MRNSRGKNLFCKEFADGVIFKYFSLDLPRIEWYHNNCVKTLELIALAQLTGLHH
ncbi:MAG: hypothetical protein SOR72_07225 [Hornefia sp.]|nr:hypothetical protein [Hornefia sp.]